MVFQRPIAIIISMTKADCIIRTIILAGTVSEMPTAIKRARLTNLPTIGRLPR